MTVLNHSAHYHRAVLLCALAAIVCSFDGRIGAQTRDNSVDVSRASTAEADFFESRIRPLLLARCIECHGAKKQESGLRLDSRDNVLKGNDEGPVVLLKQPEQSRLLHAVQQDGEIKMPPNGKLTGDQIAALAEWIKLGLPWPEGHGGVLDPAEAISAKARLHWAFKPVGAPELPMVARQEWVRSPIDRFVLSRLESAGLTPSPVADKRTLIRRAYFDLIGLPPTAAEIAQFELDNSTDAFAKVIDELLESPHYGERWGRFWLDLARYSDTKGYIFNEDRNFPHAYNYRDWVVRALNDDLPYDRFLLAQIAADCLSTRHGSDDPSLAAMGFLTLGRRFLGIKPDIIDDRIDVLFRSTMALTVGCARCHDHKFDPIPSADYYSIYGVFDAAAEKQVPIEKMTPEFEKGLRDHEDQVQRTLAEGHAKVAAELRAKAAEYLVAAYEANQRGAPRTDDYDFVPFVGELNPFFINRWRTYLDDTSDRLDPVMAPFHAFAALGPEDFAAKADVLAKRFATNADEPQKHINPLVAKLFEAGAPHSLPELAQRYASLLNETSDQWQKLIADAEKNGHSPPTDLPQPEREQLRQVFYGPYAPTNVPTQDVELLLDQKTKDKVAELRRKLVSYAAGPGAPKQAMILEEIEPAHNPRIFVRGNSSRPGAEVPRQFLGVITPNRKPFTHKSGRLEMAEQIVSKDNPLTARVFVNRVWAGHFGTPLVKTPSDFGLRSESPSLPELLDYLARTFMDDGWSIKRLHRRILLSSAYQQASDFRPECAAVDQENRLLWRMNRRRLDWEATRDSLLAVAGDLDPHIGGPAVEIAAPPYSRRRTIYGRIDRQNLPGLFRAFDFASPDAHAPQRFITTVPQQALFLLNGPFAMERAEAIAMRTRRGTDEESAARIGQIYRTVFGRSPTAQELSLGMAFVSKADAAVPPPSAAQLLAEAWQYGWGAFDEKTMRVRTFVPFSHFTGSAWQTSPAMPDPQTGWAMITAEGGHPGNDQEHAAIRRWIAPANGAVHVEGTLKVTEAGGDGIRARIVSSRSGQAGEWSVEPNKKPESTNVGELLVQAGDAIDFVVDLRGTIQNDSFAWTARLQLDRSRPASEAKSSGRRPTGLMGSDSIVWDSAATFRKPVPQPLDVWSRYIQVLLMSNEFIYVD